MPKGLKFGIIRPTSRISSFKSIRVYLRIVGGEHLGKANIVTEKQNKKRVLICLY